MHPIAGALAPETALPHVATSNESSAAYLLGGRSIFFPFFNGAFEYECETCDAPCCKGAPLGISRSRELVTLQSVQPHLPLFATPGFAGSAMLSLSTPKEACWFLNKKNKCRLERVGGREAKPAGCRLFPFHRLRMAGHAVVVMPDFLCPLTLSDRPNERAQNSYDALTLEMHRARVPARGHAALPAPLDLGWSQALRTERLVVNLSADHLGDPGYVAFAEAQHQLASRASGATAPKDAMNQLRRTLREFLDVKADASREGLRELIAVTPVLRMMASSIPRKEITGMLVALSVLLGAYEDMRGGRRTPRTIISLFEQRLPLLYTLSHLDHRPTFGAKVDPTKLVGTGPVGSALQAVLQEISANESRDVARPLRSILAEQGEIFRAPHTAEGVAMLFSLGRVLLRSARFVSL